MPQRTRRMKVILLHMIILPTLYFVFTFFTLGPKPYTGVDEAVVEKIAKEHGRAARRPLLDPGEGDLLLFAFLVAGVVGGFSAGYYWRALTEKRTGNNR
jgi:cobalt/nickel transport protein